MPVTRYGVYHDLSESTYSMSIGGIEYFFSSKVYMRKFKEQVSDNRINLIAKFFKAGIMINPVYIADLALYQKIEKRGFRVVYKGRELTWQQANENAQRLGTLPLLKS
jgi:YHS domain-containing protein